MKTFQLTGSKRENIGKKAAKAYRKGLLIPCVLYGGGVVIHFTVSYENIRRLIYTPEIYIIELTIDNQIYTAILKETQFDPVSDELIHADFLQIAKDKPVVLEIPVVLEGLAEGVKAGGKLSLEMRKLRVKGLYPNFPEKLIVNVENLGLGKTIQVGNLHFDNLELQNVKDKVVVSVKSTRSIHSAVASAALTPTSR